MQGLALANGKPLAGISALDAIHDARQLTQPSALSPQPWQRSRRLDGRRARTGVFGRLQNGDVVEAALVDKPAEILARWARERTHPTVFAGDGALAYRDLIRAARPGAHIVEPVPPLAPSIARLAEATRARSTGASSPDAIRPIYVRRSDVELARDRSAAAPTVLRRERP